ncbi:MAG: hypothetical protein KF805_12615 [Phycisphaeraceae bacterium]|nr:hypothetical protein [Phycisphaeraceae bacterium]
MTPEELKVIAGRIIKDAAWQDVDVSTDVKLLLAHIDTLEGYKREALAARLNLRPDGISSDHAHGMDDRYSDAQLAYARARAANTQEKKVNP